MSTDEEQIEALKLWWSENGTTLIIAVALALVALFGYRTWDSRSSNHAAEASDIYQQITELIGLDPPGSLTDEEISTVTYLNTQLRSEYEDTIYARYAALFMARLHVEANELDQAEAELSWILDNPGLGMFSEVESSLLKATRARLARVVLAKGETQRAMDLITSVEAGEYEPVFAEVEGDILIAMGRRDEARAAYERARAAGNASALLELKLDDLGA